MKTSDLELRAFDNQHGKENEKMIYWDDQAFNGYLSKFISWIEQNGNKMPLMLFTGKVDKYGKKIWVGDIVKMKNGSVDQVIFKNGSFSINIVHGRLFDYEDYELEIVGDIFKNRDLLEFEFYEDHS